MSAMEVHEAVQQCRTQINGLEYKVQDQTRQITALSKQMKQTESALKEELEKHDVTRQRAEAAQNRAKELENHLRDEKNTTADLRSELQSRNQDLRKKDEDFKKFRRDWENKFDLASSVMDNKPDATMTDTTLQTPKGPVDNKYSEAQKAAKDANMDEEPLLGVRTSLDGKPEGSAFLAVIEKGAEAMQNILHNGWMEGMAWTEAQQAFSESLDDIQAMMDEINAGTQLEDQQEVQDTEVHGMDTEEV